MRKIATLVVLALSMVVLAAPLAAAHETSFTCVTHSNLGPTTADAQMCVRVNGTVFQYHEGLTEVTLLNPNGPPPGVETNVISQSIEIWLDDNCGSHTDKELLQTVYPSSYDFSNGPREQSTAVFSAGSGIEQWQSKTTWKYYVTYSGGNWTSATQSLTSNWTVCD